MYRPLFYPLIPWSNHYNYSCSNKETIPLYLVANFVIAKRNHIAELIAHQRKGLLIVKDIFVYSSSRTMFIVATSQKQNFS